MVGSIMMCWQAMLMPMTASAHAPLTSKAPAFTAPSFQAMAGEVGGVT
jgi:methionine-rich copper-binding protein CopC